MCHCLGGYHHHLGAIHLDHLSIQHHRQKENEKGRTSRSPSKRSSYPSVTTMLVSRSNAVSDRLGSGQAPQGWRQGFAAREAPSWIQVKLLSIIHGSPGAKATQSHCVPLPLHRDNGDINDFLPLVPLGHALDPLAKSLPPCEIIAPKPVHLQPLPKSVRSNY